MKVVSNQKERKNCIKYGGWAVPLGIVVVGPRDAAPLRDPDPMSILALVLHWFDKY